MAYDAFSEKDDHAQRGCVTDRGGQTEAEASHNFSNKDNLKFEVFQIFKIEAFSSLLL